MPEYDNENQFVLFKNDRKTTEKHPDCKGSGQAGGVEYWASGWWRVSNAGDTRYLKVLITPKDQQPAAQPAPQQTAQDADPFDVPATPPAMPPTRTPQAPPDMPEPPPEEYNEPPSGLDIPF